MTEENKAKFVLFTMNQISRFAVQYSRRKRGVISEQQYEASMRRLEARIRAQLELIIDEEHKT